MEDNRRVDLGDGRYLTISISREGVVMDVWGTHTPGTEAWTDNETGIDASHLGTVGMMFDEWADWIAGLAGDPRRRVDTARDASEG